MNYLSNYTFGTKALELTALTTSAPIYAGQYNKNGVNYSETAKTATAVDMSEFKGNLKNRYTIRLELVKKLVGTGLTYIDVTFYYLETEDADEGKEVTKVFVRVPVTSLNDATNTPIEIGIPSFKCGRFIRMGLETDATAITAGAIVCAVEPSGL